MISDKTDSSSDKNTKKAKNKVLGHLLSLFFGILLGGLLHQAGEVVIRQRNMSIGIDLGDHLRSSFSGLAAAKPAAALYESLAIIHHFSPLEQGISEKFILARGFNIPFTKFTAQEYILFTEV
jgi:hypothetical protein